MAFRDDFKLNRRSAVVATAAAAAAAKFGSVAAQDATPAADASPAAVAAPTQYEPQGPQVEKLVFWTRSSPDSSPNEFNALTAVSEKYTEYTGTPVELVTVPDGDFRTRLSLAAPAGDGPDIFGPVAHDWIGQLALQEIAAATSEADLVGFEDISDLIKTAITFDGQLYGYPLFSESLVLFHYTDIIPEAPTTWDELVTEATEATTGDQWGFAFEPVQQYYQGPFIHAFGGYIFGHHEDGTPNYEDIGLNNEGSVEAAKFIRDMFNNQIPPLPEDVIDQANAGGFIDGLDEAGLLGMRIIGPWRAPALRDAGVPFQMALLPAAPNGEPLQPFSGIQVMQINAFGEQQEAALDLLNYMGSVEGVNLMWQGFGKPPVHESLRESVMETDPNMVVVWDQVAGAVPMPNIPQMDQVWQPWGDAMVGIVSQNVSDEEVQALLDTAVEQIKANIAAN